MKKSAKTNKKNTVMVCVTSQKSCDHLIAKGVECLDGGELHVVHCVETGRNFMNSPFESDAIEYLFTAAQLAGAELSLLRAEDVENALVDFAKSRGATIIVMGAPGKGDGREPLSLRLQNRLPQVQFIIVSSGVEMGYGNGK